MPDPRIGEKILVADPSPEVKEAIARSLADFGYTAVFCDNFAEAEAAVRGSVFWLAFIDVDLPGGGLALARELTALQPQLALVFMAGRETFEDAVKAIRLGAYDYLRKPLSQAEVAVAVSRYAERAHLEELAFQAQQQYAHLVQNIPLIIFSLNPDLSLEFINQACAFVLGFEPHEAVRDRGFLLSRLAPADRSRVGELLKSAFSCAAPFSTECRVLAKNGRLLSCIIQTMPCREAAGRPGAPRLEGVIMDITERVLLEKALVQDEKLKTLGAISAEVAHEIRNPLVSIGGFARRLKAREPDSTEAEIILREARRLERLLDRVRNYVKPVRITRAPLSVNQVLSECLNLLFPEMEGRGVWCSLSLSEDLPEIRADRDMLAQVVINLVLSALDSVDRASEITAATFAVHGRVELEIGYNPTRHGRPDPERMFYPFEEDGQGLGLPLSYRLAKSMGGLLSYSREGDRAVFRLSLPQTEETGEDGNPRDMILDFGLPVDTDDKLAARDKDFEERLQRQWRKASRESASLAVILVDADHFESFAALAGREAAREALAALRAAIAACLREPDDFLEPQGGQQFLAVLPGSSEEEASAAAECARGAVEALGLRARSDHSSPLTVSAGVAAATPGPGTELRDLISAASQALFVAKKTGRNRVHSA